MGASGRKLRTAGKLSLVFFYSFCGTAAAAAGERKIGCCWSSTFKKCSRKKDRFDETARFFILRLKKRFLRKKLLTRLLFAFRFLLGGSARWRHWSAGVQTPVGKLFLIGGLEKTRIRWRELVSERGSYFILKNNLALFAKCYDGRDDQEEGSAHQ